MNLKNKYISIIGAGESGVGAALLAKKIGADVFVSDFNLITDQFRKELEDNDISYEENGHTLDKIGKADLIIKSPGIPNNTPVIKFIKESKITVLSEIEFASRFSSAKTICITGSNGKTTTTMLVYHILKSAGYSVGFGGNIGKSFARQLASSDYEYYVLELSSFQLDDLKDFRADISVLLNITPDHLDRYENDMNLYVNSKMKIINNQTEKDWLIYNADDSRITSALKKKSTHMNLATFSLLKKQEVGGYLNKEQIIINAVPGSNIMEDKFGNPIAVMPDGKSFYLNKPGASFQDVAQTTTQILSYIPGYSTIAKKFAGNFFTRISRVIY